MTILEKIKFEEDWLSEVNLTKENIKIALAGIRATALEQARWIPVSERLPERDVDVLTYHRNESFDYQYVSWIDCYSGKWSGFIGNLSDEVIAWMPLPQPYGGN